MAKIMIVDDEADIRDSVKTLLESEGYQTILASNGNECLTKIKKDQPDLVLLDIMMPGMTAKDVVKQMNNDDELKKIRIIYLTAVSTSDEEKEKMKKLGHVVDYIGKPYDMEDLLESVKKALK